MSKKFKSQLVESLITLFIGLVAVVIAVFLIAIASGNFGIKKNEQLNKIEDDTQKIKKTIIPYEYKNELQKVTIVENFSNFTKRGQPTDSFTKYLSVMGLFEQGYLYVKASVNDHALTDNDNVYVKLTSLSNGQYQEYGGHLIKGKSLDTPKSDNWTELLYELPDIKYKKNYYTNNVEVLSADWLRLFNEGANQSLIGFSSSVDKGQIIELSIYYKCIQGQECSIGVK